MLHIDYEHIDNVSGLKRTSKVLHRIINPVLDKIKSCYGEFAISNNYWLTEVCILTFMVSH